jgi:hypothetical protein
MGAPTSDIGYTTAIARRGDHEIHMDMWWHWKKKFTLVKCFNVLKVSCGITLIPVDVSQFEACPTVNILVHPMKSVPLFCKISLGPFIKHNIFYAVNSQEVQNSFKFQHFTSITELSNKLTCVI